MGVSLKIMRILAIGLLATVLSIGVACGNGDAGEAPMPGSNEPASPDPASPPAAVSMPAPPSWGQRQECDLPNSVDLPLPDLAPLEMAGELFEDLRPAAVELLQGAEEWLPSNQCLLIEGAVVLQDESDETIVIRAAGGERLALGGFVNYEFSDSPDFYIGCLDLLFKGELEIPDDLQSTKEVIVALGELFRLFEPALADQEITLTVIWNEDTDSETGYPLVQCLRTDQPSKPSTIRHISLPPIRTLAENGSPWGDTVDCGLPAEEEGSELLECVLIESATVLGIDSNLAELSLSTRNGVIQVSGIAESAEAPELFLLCQQATLGPDIRPPDTLTLEGYVEYLIEFVALFEPVSIGEQVTLVAIIPEEPSLDPATCWWKV